VENTANVREARTVTLIESKNEARASEDSFRPSHLHHLDGLSLQRQNKFLLLHDTLFEGLCSYQQYICHML